MSELAELNAAVRKLNDLWIVCTDTDQKDQIREKRDNLDDQAAELADLTLREGTEELNDAIAALNELTEMAIEAEKEINKVGKSIKKTAVTINKATNAAIKVAALIA